MRLTPKSVFFGLLVLGLPFAMTVGWTLGTPVATPFWAKSAPGAIGGFGGSQQGSGDAAAPARETGRSQPVLSSSAAPKPPSSSPAAVSPRATVPAAVTASGLPIVSITPLPPLTDPPVPTPTAYSEPPSPSPTESTIPSADPSSGGIGAGLFP